MAGSPVRRESVDLALALNTSATSGCRLDLGDDQLLVQISAADGTQVWDTAQCPSAVPDGTLALLPGWQLSTTVTWTGRLGDRGCTGLTEFVATGSYAVRRRGHRWRARRGGLRRVEAT